MLIAPINIEEMSRWAVSCILATVATAGFIATTDHNRLAADRRVISPDTTQGASQRSALLNVRLPVALHGRHSEKNDKNRKGNKVGKDRRTEPLHPPRAHSYSRESANPPTAVPAKAQAVHRAQRTPAPAAPAKEQAVQRAQHTPAPAAPAKEQAVQRAQRTPAPVAPAPPAKAQAVQRAQRIPAPVAPVPPAKAQAVQRAQRTPAPVAPVPPAKAQAVQRAQRTPAPVAPVPPAKAQAVHRAQRTAAPVAPVTPAKAQAVQRAQRTPAPVAPAKAQAVHRAQPSPFPSDIHRQAATDVFETNTNSGKRAAVPLYRPRPIYPKRAERKGVEGRVEVLFTIAETGRVVRPVIVSASPPNVFDDTVLKTVAQWKYHPARISGVPTAQPDVRLTIEFELRD